MNNTPMSKKENPAKLRTNNITNNNTNINGN